MLYLQIDIRKNITKNERDVVDMVIDYKIIGKRIKAERAKHKFTQEEMAEKLNTSVAFYSRIETGRSHVNLTRIMEIANILNVSAGYFLTGIEEDGTTFWRTKKKSAPHNALTSTEKILKSAQNKKYRTTSTKESVLKYVTDEVNLEDGESATSITIPHSNLQTVKYEYDEQNKVYKRYARKKAQTDWTTGKNLTTKNIIITMCDNETLDDGENKGRQTLKNIGTFNGYYITNGKAIKIKCIKKARNEQTIYEDLQGNEIKVNDGNTWVNICPTDAKIVIEGSEETEQENTKNNI
jgi:transcriptional regulator with XRE-family HTH domain